MPQLPSVHETGLVYRLAPAAAYGESRGRRGVHDTGEVSIINTLAEHGVGARLDQAHCAVLCMELQRGIVGDLSTVAPLRAAVEEQGVIPNCEKLLASARRHGIPVIHCTAEFRSDRRGSSIRAPLLDYMARLPGHIESGSAAARVVPELAPAAEDFIVSRLHGVSPFTGTSLDVTLRNLGVDTLLVAGVSLNLGILGLTIEAVNLGYRVILLEDAVAGFPAAYVTDIKRYTLRHIAWFHTCQQLMDHWATSRAVP